MMGKPWEGDIAHTVLSDVNPDAVIKQAAHARLAELNRELESIQRERAYAQHEWERVSMETTRRWNELVVQRNNLRKALED